MHSTPIFSNNLNLELEQTIEKLGVSKVIIICDENTKAHCLTLIKSSLYNEVISVNSGEQSKSVSTYEKICNQLLLWSADKNSLLISLGGGVVSDLTGFVAATYKRGIKYINIPTSLLGMVDAAIGGKTGVNAGGIKNSLGAIHFPEAVLSSSELLKTLPKDELLSGYGEVVKHCFISGIPFPNFSNEIDNEQLSKWSEVKYQVVSTDPLEKHERFILNAGHTVAHALESFAMKHKFPLKHGHAVVHGLLIEGALAGKLSNNLKNLSLLQNELIKVYGKFPFASSDIPILIEKMKNDKKNQSTRIQFSFISKENKLALQSARLGDIEKALETYLKW